MPIGNIDREIITFVLKAVEDKFGFPTKENRALAVPVYAFDMNRGQYEARIILNYIERHRSVNEVKVLGIIEEDLFAKGLNYIFGQAKLGGCCGVISLARLREGTENPDGKRLLFKRIEKEAFHELGHAFGLRHCPNPRCVMYYSSGLSDTDRKSTNFCLECGLPAGLR